MFREQVADLCHKQWSGWMRYLFSRGEFDEHGRFIIPKSLVERWTRQMNTDYNELSEPEKESDRNEADKFLQLGLGKYHLYSSHEWGENSIAIYQDGKYLCCDKGDVLFAEALYRLNLPFKEFYIRGIEFYQFPQNEIDLEPFITNEDQDYNIDEDEFWDEA